MPILKLIGRLSFGFLSVALAVVLSTPAQAFSLQVPKAVKDSFRSLLAQEGQIIQQPQQPGTLGQFQPQPMQSGPVSGSTGQFQSPTGSSGQFQSGPNQVGPNQGINTDMGIRDQYQGINIDQGIRNQPMDGQGQNQGPNQGQNQGQMGPNNQGPNQGQMGPSKQDQERQLRDMKNNMKPMENNLKQFEKQMQANEKKGQKLSPEMQQKLADVKSKMESIKNSTSAEDLQNFDMGELNNEMQELEQTRREAEEGQRRVQDMQRNMKGAEQGLTQFEKQVSALAKKKVAIPAELTASIQKIKTIFAAVKKAKTWEEMEAAGVEDLQDLMMGLDEYRQQLDMLMRWPQTQKQLDQEIKRLDTEYKRSQTVVKNLAKKGIDLASELNAFKEAINGIKAVRNQAAAKIKSGTSEDIQAAFELLESEFFGQMDDVWQYQRIIGTMSNLGQFQNDFKRRISEAQKLIAQLKRQKIDTTELAMALNEINEKGKEILAMLKAKPIDQEAVMDALQELEGLGSQFEDLVVQTRGEGEEMPWEQGPSQFKSPMDNFSAIQKLIPQKPKEETAQSSGQTCNINGVEVPGPC